MLNKLNIRSRLILLIAIQVFVLIVIGVTSLSGLKIASSTTSELNTHVKEGVYLSNLNSIVQNELLDTVSDVYVGVTTWQIGKERLSAAGSDLEQAWANYTIESGKSNISQNYISLSKKIEQVNVALEELTQLFDNRDRGYLSLFVLNELDGLTKPFLDELQTRVAAQQSTSELALQASQKSNSAFLYGASIAVVLATLISGILGYLIYGSIRRPIESLSTTVNEIKRGNYAARTGLSGDDELAHLGVALDSMINDKVTNLALAERENTLLNGSIISLLQAVSLLSQKDLTIKVPVTEDVTGPVADALNMLTRETGNVLQGVRKISEDVATACAKVKAQSGKTIIDANAERIEVERTAEDLSNTVKNINQISVLANACNESAGRAITTTQTALNTVTSTVTGINTIRETIYETEKRIKRLGERSQEIGGAVNLINSISERTHILALNASMHAASAGEAGRGFAVVADEVQRLAENAQNATSQISSLVHNIQVETADTVLTMNNVISQVVDGSRLAELAGEQMKKTQQSTAELVASVQQIASSSLTQVQLSKELEHRAQNIKESTRQTSEQLQQQTEQTDQLVHYSDDLLNAVNVFKLSA